MAISNQSFSLFFLNILFVTLIINIIVVALPYDNDDDNSESGGKHLGEKIRNCNLHKKFCQNDAMKNDILCHFLHDKCIDMKTLYMISCSIFMSECNKHFQTDTMERICGELKENCEQSIKKNSCVLRDWCRTEINYFDKIVCQMIENKCDHD